MCRLHLAVDNYNIFQRYLPQARKVWRKLKLDHSVVPRLGELGNINYVSDIMCMTFSFSKKFPGFMFHLYLVYHGRKYFDFSFLNSKLLMLKHGENLPGNLRGSITEEIENIPEGEIYRLGYQYNNHVGNFNVTPRIDYFGHLSRKIALDLQRIKDRDQAVSDAETIAKMVKPCNMR